MFWSTQTFPSEILGGEKISAFWRSGLKVKAEPQRGRGNEAPAREGSSVTIVSKLRAEIPEGVNPERKELLFSLRAGKRGWTDWEMSRGLVLNDPVRNEYCRLN